MYQFIGYFLFLALQLSLIDNMKVEHFWSYYPNSCAAFPHHLGICCELLSNFCHLLTPICSSFFILSWSGWFFHSLNSSCHMLGTSMVYEHFCSSCSLYLSFWYLFIVFFFCSFPFTAVNSLLSFVASINVFGLFEPPLFWSWLIPFFW